MSIDVPSDHPHSPLSDEELFCLEGCRTYKQYYSMRQGFERQICAFCHPDPELNRIVWQDDWMMVWHIHEKFMRTELRLHILIVPKRHVRFMADLSVAEWVSLGFATEWTKQHFNYSGGLFHARDGDMQKNAGTVPHLHINIFEPNGNGEVRVPVFKDEGDRAENMARAARFAALYEDGVAPKAFELMVADGTYTKEGSRSQPPGHSEC